MRRQFAVSWSNPPTMRISARSGSPMGDSYTTSPNTDAKTLGDENMRVVASATAVRIGVVLIVRTSGGLDAIACF